MIEKNKKEQTKELRLKIEALIIAIPSEEEAHDHYMELAESYSDETSKEMFTYLAKEELMHKRKLESLLGKLEAQLVELEASND